MPTYQTYKLGEICELLNGFAFKSSNYVQSGLRVIRITNVKKGYVIDEEPQFYPLETQEELKKYILKKGDLLISLTGNVGRVGILSEDLLPAALNQRVGCLRVKDKSLVSLQYLFHLLNTNSFEKDCINSSKGIAQKNMSTEWLKEYEISLPPLPTQHAIVTRIETLFAELDKAVQHLRTAQQQLKIYRQAVLNETMKTANYVSVGDVIEELGQGWSPKCCNEPSLNDTEWGVIKTTAIQPCGFIEGENKKLPQNLEPRQRHELKVGDILITRAGPKVRVGVCCLIKKVRPRLINCDKAYRILLKKDIINAQYFEYVMNSPTCVKKIDELKTGISDSGVNLTQNRFFDLQIPLPSLPEQQRIVKEIESRLSQTEATEACIAESLHQTEALRQSILKKAFSGELV